MRINRNDKGRIWLSASLGVLFLVRSATFAQDAGTVEVGVQISIEDAGGHALEPFHRALRHASTATHPVRVIVFGDSHTAGNVLPSVLKRILADRFGDAGLGYFFPIRTWRYYLADGVTTSRAPEWLPLRVRANDRSTQALGLAGVAVEASTAGASAEFSFTHARDAERVELWSYAQPSGGSLMVSFDNRAPMAVSLAANAPRLVVTDGGSSEGTSRVRIESVQAEPARIFGVVAERRTTGVVVDALGINGARLADQLSWDDAIFQEALTRRDPALVLFQYGTNESGDDAPLARVEEEMRRAVARVRETVPGSSCVLVGPTDRPERVRRRQYVHRVRTDEVRAIQRRVAASQGCGYFDTVEFQGGPLSTATWASLNPPYAARDRVHLTRLGYQRWATVLANALLEHY